MCKYTLKPVPIQEACCASAVKTANDIVSKTILIQNQGASLIVAITETGLTARLISKYKPPQHILALW